MEQLITFIGAIVYDGKLPVIPSELEDYEIDFPQDAYDKDSPVAFPIDIEYLIKDTTYLPNRTADGWSITMISEQDIYSKEAIIDNIIGNLKTKLIEEMEKFYNSKDEKVISDYLEKLKIFLLSDEDKTLIKYGKFVYRYFR